MKNYIYSDLALEGASMRFTFDPNSSEITESQIGEIRLLSLKIDSSELIKKYNRQKGTYVTVFCKKIWLMNENELEECSKVVGKQISGMISSLLPSKSSSDISALVVGLGNSDITPDAIGPLTVSSLTVTRHLPKLAPDIFERIGECRVAAFIPGVLGQTGIEAQELVKGAVLSIKPDIVIAIDALAARSCERLSSTVQISDTGISPGSGIGNTGKAINEKSLGVPVIAVGVPTVVDSATLVYDALNLAGISEISSELQAVLDNGKSFFVSPKECDVISESVGDLLARSLDRAFRLE